MHTVKRLATLAGVSVRTLHYYDEIGLLTPTEIGAHNGYRYYDDAALLRLQQVLFYRELGLELAEIKAILDDPRFDLITALRSHRDALQGRVERLHRLIRTVDSTLMHLIGDVTMDNKKLFEPFDDETQRQYEREIRLSYNADLVDESRRRWNSYSEAEKQRVMDEGNALYDEIVEALKAGHPSDSDAVQALFRRWHEHLRYFYEPPLEVLRGLGDLYTTHPDFIARFQALHPDLPDYLKAGIEAYTDALETAVIARMLADDAQSGQSDQA